MHNQVAVEALHSATYVKNYLDSVENLPDDVQRHLSRIREIDVQYQGKPSSNTAFDCSNAYRTTATGHLRDVDYYYEQWTNCSINEIESTNTSKRRAMTRIQQCLIAAQELGDEKLQIVTQMQELIDLKTRQLENDFKNLDYGKDEPVLELQLKEQLPAVAAHISNNHNSPALASPVITTNIAPTFNIVVAAVQQPAVLSASAAASSNASAAERFTAPNNNTSISSVNNTSSERVSKRPRRARNDNNGTNNGLDTSTSVDLGVSAETPQKQVPTTNASAPASTPTNTGGQKKSTTSNATTSGTVGSVVGVASSTTASSGRKTKKRKSGRAQAATNSNNQQSTGNTMASSSREPNRDDTPPAEETIDPDEPTYCLCDQISFGEMILCDNDLCPIEWFHFSCVSLLSKPKGKWFCPNCRGDRPNIMKPKAQFLKELERYNKEKEEKT